MSVAHSTFAIERRFKASRARVFNAWADPQIKNSWRSCHEDWRSQGFTLNFCVGGEEWEDVIEPGGTIHGFAARYHDIIDNERIVYAYDMRLDGRLISVSLVTVTFEDSGAGTKMLFTEQLTILDGLCDAAEREEGAELGLDRMVAVIDAN